MSFIWPVMLLSLVLIPLFAALYLRLLERRRRLVAQYAGLGLRSEAAGRSPGLRRHLPPALFLAGLTILLVAMARPQAIVNLPRIEGSVILAFDVSGSMAADDIQPTRMEAAKAAARDFVQRQPRSVQIGVVAFSDGGFSIQAPTNDTEAVFAAIDRLTPQRGTSVGHGILASLNTIARNAGVNSQEEPLPGQNPPGQDPQGQDPGLAGDPSALPEGPFPSAAIVLLTDGENNASPDPLAAAQAAAERGVRIYTVGVGSAAGTVLTINGFTVHTQLDEPALQNIAQLTGGEYYNAADEEDLRAIYENLSLQLAIKPEAMEITSIFAGASLLVMLVGGVFSLLLFGRLP